jgi:formylglycine-generating enzyme required for sulfatase activity
VSPPARQVSPPPPVVRADPSAEEAAAWRIASRTDTVAAYNAYLADYPNGRNASTARQRIAAPTPRVSPPPPPPITSLDARSTPADTRAPVMTNPSGLPDFALFRECDGCPEMVVIPGGSFMMGSPASEAEGDNDEDSQAGAGGAQVSVRVPRFAISRFETTWEEWGACVSASVCQQQEDEGYGRGRRPAINVDWETDTRAYVRFVNSRASGYRLPSEAEWEYAARAGTTTAFSWGNSISTGQAQYSWSISYNGGPTRTTTPAGTATVGSFQANPWGLYDMHGNVWEWVEDCYRDNLSGQTAAAYTSGDCSLRVLRGGSWNYSPQNLRSASRGWASSTVRGLFGGFRLARTL